MTAAIPTPPDKNKTKKRKKKEEKESATFLEDSFGLIIEVLARYSTM